MRTTVFLIAPLVLAFAGCNGTPPAQAPDPETQAPLNRAMVQWLNSAAIDNAILSQHTLYPYHFVPHSPELNDLGRRDLAVLANHFRRHPGVINIRRTETTAALYAARLESVRRMTVDMGVPADRIEFADGIPGGDGDYSERVLRVRAAAAAATAASGSVTAEQ